MKKASYIAAALGMSAGIALGGAAENMKRYDQNKDGKLQKFEFFAMWAGWDTQKGKDLDQAKYEKYFKNKDKDSDGSLSIDELQ
jgi:Ca2+-binding EF-hand superfamily protein